MKIQRALVVLLVSLLGQSTLAADGTISGLPRSANPLVNQIVETISMQQKPSLFLQQLAIANLSFTPQGSFPVFMDFVEANRQISKETLIREADQSKIDRTGMLSASRTDGSYYVNIHDARLFHVASGSNPLGSPLSLILSRLYTLTNSEFQNFAGQYLAMLSESLGDVLVLNRLQGRKVGGERGEPLNSSYGSMMLYSLFMDPEFFYRLGLAPFPKSKVAELQDARVAELISRALKRYRFFNSAQEANLVEFARKQTKSRDVRGTKQAGFLANIVNGFEYRAARMCSTLFESVTPYMYPRSQWP